MKGWTAHDKQQHAFPPMVEQVEEQHCSLHTWPGSMHMGTVAHHPWMGYACVWEHSCMGCGFTGCI